MLKQAPKSIKFYEPKFDETYVITYAHLFAYIYNCGVQELASYQLMKQTNATVTIVHRYEVSKRKVRNKKVGESSKLKYKVKKETKVF